LTAPAQALADHAFCAEFDANKPVHLEGVISRVEFINPHAWIYVDVKGQDGKTGPPRIRGHDRRSIRSKGTPMESSLVHTP
jgi:Family of unknown function (DUF6152)